ncbi:MAG: type II toxin-antitoxin system YoeB family toxin [Phycisphaerae bacterium]|nr:type II toxin-antitoxin system YoeB family toxin [Phycisphaerae bacterium]MBI9019037.1 type II toxin-antitoxin system YoeB family toxin [Phycisphaerae bacterium]
MKSEIKFSDERVRKALQDLKKSKTEDKQLYRWIMRAFEDLEGNAFCGIQIPKKLIPKIYINKYGIDNLWKYDLPKSWRLIYSVANGQICIVSIILEWMSHKDYERRFSYN